MILRDMEVTGPPLLPLLRSRVQAEALVVVLANPTVSGA